MERDQMSISDDQARAEQHRRFKSDPEERRWQLMRKIVATAKCYRSGCGGTMEGRKGEYRYLESGLDSVILKDILVFHCTKCNTIVPEIPAAGLR